MTDSILTGDRLAAHEAEIIRLAIQGYQIKLPCTSRQHAIETARHFNEIVGMKASQNITLEWPLQSEGQNTDVRVSRPLWKIVT